MLISEIFYSIQGEGSLTGVPSVFVRTSGCNLRCRWCDTPYASWQPEGTERTVAEIVEEVQSHPASHVVLTGGEPMVAKGIHELAAALKTAGKHITIETAGTIAPEGIACDLASISPKLRDSTPDHRMINPGWVEKHERLRLQPDVLREWLTAYPFQLKFVVADAGQAGEIDALLEAIGLAVAPANVHLMPEGTTEEALHSRQEMLVDLCKQRGFRYCDRLHIKLFGNSRGT